MDLLFKRNQTAGKLAKVQFKLWGKVELTEDEQALVKRYRFDEAILIAALQPNLIRNTAFVAVAAFLAVFAIFSMAVASGFAMFLAIAAGVGAGYWFLNETCSTKTTHNTAVRIWPARRNNFAPSTADTTSWYTIWLRRVNAY